jgi:hypothetical protein
MTAENEPQRITKVAINEDKIGHGLSSDNVAAVTLGKLTKILSADCTYMTSNLRSSQICSRICIH